jgi:4,5-DOPA dioxygenase extradiol
MATPPLPTLFLSHGAPSLVLETVPGRDFLSQLGRQLPHPRAIIIISAHWATASPQADASPHPRTIHDFSGFPPALAALRYAAPGSPALAADICQRLTNAGMACTAVERGLDHGAWVPLMLIYPQADIPVVQLSIQPHQDAGHHLRLGQALSGFPVEDVLIIASGSATHNLRELGSTSSAPPVWAQAFDDWLVSAVERGATADLIDYANRAPHAQRSHPTDEHLLPLFVALGAAGVPARGACLHRSFTHGSLSMAAFSFSRGR